jgi:hypothetical protein
MIEQHFPWEVLTEKKGEACVGYDMWHLRYCFAPTCGGTCKL